MEDLEGHLVDLAWFGGYGLKSGTLKIFGHMRDKMGDCHALGGKWSLDTSKRLHMRYWDRS